MIYLDYNSTSPYSSSVASYIKSDSLNHWMNASSVHPLGEIGSRLIQETRQNFANFLNCAPKNLVFNSGVSESIATVLSPSNLKKLGIRTVLSNKTEHTATLKSLSALENVVWVENDSNGIIDLQDLERKLPSEGDALFTISYANNETGVVQDVNRIREMTKRKNSFLHLDCAQVLGRIELDLSENAPDFASFSGHKIGSLKGVGVLFSQSPVSALINGGQESGHRGGTYNVSAIHSFDLAVADLKTYPVKRIEQLRNKFESEIKNLAKEIGVNGSGARRLCNTSNIYFGGVDNLQLLLNLAAHQIFASVGSACSSGSFEPSHVIMALGHQKSYAKSCLRFSFGSTNDERDVAEVIKILAKYLTRS